jgi:hypothetical protein
MDVLSTTCAKRRDELVCQAHGGYSLRGADGDRVAIDETDA